MRHLLIDNGPAWLNLLFFLPLAVALILPLTGRERLNRHVALAVSLVNALAVLPVLLGFDASKTAFQFVHLSAWIPHLYITFVVGVDGLSLFLLTVIVWVMPGSILAAWRSPEPRCTAALACLLALESAMIGTVIALDFVLFLFSWLGMLLPLYLLMTLRGAKSASRAAGMMLLFQVAGSTPLMAAGIGLYLENGTFFMPTMQTMQNFAHLAYADSLQYALFFAFLLAFAMRMPVFPLHVWLAPCMTGTGRTTAAPMLTLLSALGIYGLLRFLPLVPLAYARFAPGVMILAASGMLYSAWAAPGAASGARALTHIMVGTASGALMGIFTGSRQGMAAALLQGAHIAVVITGIALCLGLWAEKKHKASGQETGPDREKLHEGHTKFAISLSIFALLACPLPGLCGFPGAYLTLKTLHGHWILPLAALSLLLLTLALLHLPRMLLASGHLALRPRPDLRWRDLLPLAPALLMALVLGLGSPMILDRLSLTLDALSPDTPGAPGAPGKAETPASPESPILPAPSPAQPHRF